jgi:CRISPR-associated protein Csd1
MSMLAALVRRYERMANTGEAPVPGYSTEKISFAIVIDENGAFRDAQPLGELVKGKRIAATMTVPQPTKRTVGIAANLLWDKTAYALGVTSPEKESKRAAKKGLRPGEAEFSAFKSRQHEAIGDTDDPGLQAFLKFLDAWNPALYIMLGLPKEMVDANVIFRLDGLKQEYLHDRSAARAIVSRSMVRADAANGLCLVTGEVAPIARLHPSIKGVRGGQSSGAAIVSFNQSSFASYGKEQGDNAPVSEGAAFGYTTALNALLADKRHRVQIGDASVVFWAEPRAGEEGAARVAEDLMAATFGGGNSDNEPAPDEKAIESDLLSKLSSLAKGRPLPGLEINNASMPFYVLGLSPNAARISIRFWLDTTLDDLAARLARHYEDLRLEPLPWRTPPSFWRLLIELAAQRKTENIPVHLAGELTRAILTGGRYPLSLLTLCLARLRTDHEVNGHRAALIKATLTRLSMEVPVSLDRTELNSGYRLGRLFAVLERLQAAGLGKRNATIRDRFYASASATPARIFPSLFRNAKNHSKSVRSKVGVGLAEWFEDRIADVVDGMESALPPTLSLQDQGRFAIGYYHQREAFINKTAEAPVELDAAESEETEE